MRCLFSLAILGSVLLYGFSQPPIKPDYLKSVPTAFKNCGALYTFDSVSLSKKRFLLAVDFQNLGLISINGKLVKLMLQNDTTGGQPNQLTYTGAGYKVMLSAKTDRTVGDKDLESGTLTISKGINTLTLKIHGQSACDPATQEGNL